MSIDQYDDFADLYEMWTSLSPGRQHDGAYYLEWANDAGATRAVELGIGNGRVAVDLALGGLEIVGVDGSRAMLEKAVTTFEAAGVGSSLSAVEADFAAWISDRPERFVYCPYGSFSHLTTPERRQQMLYTLRSYMDGPQARFGFDVQIYERDVLEAIDGKRIPQGNIPLRRSEIQVERLTEVDWQRSTKLITTTAEVVSRGRSVRSQSWSFELAFLERTEFERLFEEAGFRTVAFDAGPPHAPDHDFWLLAPDGAPGA